MDEQDGLSAHELFNSLSAGRGFTFDDIIMLPGSIDFPVSDVSLETNLTRRIKLKLPIASSPMDTVTDHTMAISMAVHGGIGFIHRSNSVEEQAEQVRLVKRFKCGFITDPMCMSVSTTLSQVDKVILENGFTAFAVTEKGTSRSKLLGMVTSRDIDFLEDRSKLLGDVMTPRSELVTLGEGCSLEQAQNMIRESKKGKIPVVDESDNLISLVSRKDLLKNRDFPHASLDANEQLLCGASVGVGSIPEAKERLAALVEAGVDVVAFEARQLDQNNEIELIKFAKATYPNLEVIGGNGVTASHVERLVAAGVDGIRVGMGVASIATGQLIKAIGRPQMSAVYHTSRIASKYNVPVIADGGIANSGCAIKALSLGASVIMMGSLLAGTEESPGDYYFQDGMRLKKYRGNQSHDSLKTSHNSELHMPVISTGASGSVVDKGSVRKFIPYQAQSIRHGFQDLGAKSISIVHQYLNEGRLRFEIRSAAAQREGGVHDLHTFQKNYVH